MKFSMTGQEKGDLLIQVNEWTGLTVHERGTGSNLIQEVKVKSISLICVQILTLSLNVG